MSIFEEVTLTWAGKDFKIPPDQIMKGIAKVEDCITIGQLARASLSGDIPLAKVSAGYATLLRHAGCAVSDEDVYAVLFSDAKNMVRLAMEAVTMLQMLMVPPSSLRKETPAKKEEPAAAKAQ